jgi:hypothetical protein
VTAEWRRLVAEAIANGARCVDCGTTRNLEGDHELPVSRGGLSTRANLSIRCRKHNRAKGNRVTRYQLRVPWPVRPHPEPIAGAREVASPRSGLTSCAAGSTSAMGIATASIQSDPIGETCA